MDTLTQHYNHLKAAAEKTAGRKMCTPSDFEFLAMRIFDTTHTNMSPTTLKRFWGYLDINGYQPRKSTLDLLSIYVGHKDFDSVLLCLVCN